MDDTRAIGVLLGAVAVVGALFAPWYAIDLGPQARMAIGAGAEQLPGIFGELARGLLAVLPDRLRLTGWQAFERSDVVLLACALAAALAALLRRLDASAIAGAGAAGTVLLAMVDRPGPGEIVALQWGAHLALGGAALIVVAARSGGRRPAAPAGQPPDWGLPIASAAMQRDAERSVAPPGAR